MDSFPFDLCLFNSSMTASVQVLEGPGGFSDEELKLGVVISAFVGDVTSCLEVPNAVETVYIFKLNEGKDTVILFLVFSFQFSEK